jgi:outer membrane lipoprotein
MRGGILLLALALGACAVTVPGARGPDVDRSVSARDLFAGPEGYRGRTIVVGGEVIAVRNAPGSTELEILERPLDGDEPRRTDDSGGRFLVRSREFLDPAIYGGRRVTVIGTVLGESEGRIGEMPYRYPLLEARRVHLWPKLEARPAYYPPPYAYWWDPWWPYWPYYDDPFLRLRRPRR